MVRSCCGQAWTARCGDLLGACAHYTATVAAADHISKQPEEAEKRLTALKKKLTQSQSCGTTQEEDKTRWKAPR